MQKSKRHAYYVQFIIKEREKPTSCALKSWIFYPERSAKEFINLHKFEI